MTNPHNAHIKLTLTPNTAAPNEMVDGDIWFKHSKAGGGTFTLKAKITGRDNCEEELYTQMQNYTAHGMHQRIFNFRAPTTPGIYEVVASVISESQDELTSSKSTLIVRIK
jgi:hypothetical protein